VTITTSSPTTSSPLVTLVGNPNSGKTTLFNALTNSNYKVSNYPGVTVEKREGSLALNKDSKVRLLDLPGTYTLSGLTADEAIVTKALQGLIPSCGTPDLVVAVIDSSNLERNLYVISELLDTGIPVIAALTMIDTVEERGERVYTELLSRSLGVPVIPLIARKKQGLSDLKDAVSKALLSRDTLHKPFAWIPSSYPNRAQLELRANPFEPPQDDELITTIATMRYTWARDISSRVSPISNQASVRHNSLDAILTSKLWGIPILITVFALIFQAIFLWAQAPMEVISGLLDALATETAAILPEGMMTNLLTQGIIPGVGNVLVFVPQIAILSLCIGFLEDSGYLSRATFLLDNAMRKVGLQGRAFIPLLSSFACAVPGIMATRTIPTKIDRLITIMIAPLMSCSARLPIYVLLIGVIIPPVSLGGVLSLQGLVLLSLYVLGAFAAACISYIFKKTLHRKESCFFVMEMPPLRLPTARVVLRNAYDAVSSFIKSATTIILACSVIVWFLATYPQPSSIDTDNPVKTTYAGKIGTALEPLIRPLGFNWEIGFGILSSFPAREVFITGFSTVLNVQDDEKHSTLQEHLRQRRTQGDFSTATGLSLLIFYVFSCQCMSTLAVCRRETGSWTWTFGMFGYMTALAYCASLITYQVAVRLL
jgi:ferrous iron transport protein B